MYLVVCPAGWVTFHNSCYKIDPKSSGMTFREGLRYCGSSFDGTMAVANSPKEGEFMAAYIRGITQNGYSNDTKSGQLGGKQGEENVFLEWIDGTIMADGYFTNDLGNETVWMNYQTGKGIFVCLLFAPLTATLITSVAFGWKALIVLFLHFNWGYLFPQVRQDIQCF